MEADLNCKPGLTEEWSTEQQMQELQMRMMSVDSIINRTEKLTLRLNPNNVLVVVPPKHGITWLLHICHQIRMKGQEPDFEDQWDVVCLIEAHKTYSGKNPEDQKQPAFPYIYGTHLPYPLVPDGCRKIFSFRDPKDVIVSAWHCMDSLIALKGRVTLPLFAYECGLHYIEKHLVDLVPWWNHRNDQDLLLIFFDDLKEDHAGTVCRIAKFMGVDLDDEAIARVVHTTSHAEMSRHSSSKFDTRKLSLMLTEKFGDKPPPEEEFTGRVRKDGGKSGEGKEKLPDEVQLLIDQMWQEIVTSKLGFKNLREMRDAWKTERCN